VNEAAPHRQERRSRPGGSLPIGGTVRRPATAATPIIAELLPYLEECGFGASPRFLGVDVQGWETLSWVPGVVVADEAVWSLDLDALTHLGAVLRRLHDRTAHWRPQRTSLTTRGSSHADIVVIHGDVAPRNTVWRAGCIEALIDWEYVCLAPRWWEVAHAVWQFAPYWADEDLVARAWPCRPDRLARATALLRGYGWAPGGVDLTKALARVMEGTRADLLRRAGDRPIRDPADQDDVDLVERAIHLVRNGPRASSGTTVHELAYARNSSSTSLASA